MLVILGRDFCLQKDANLAQLVEHFIRNERVVGSNPIVGSFEVRSTRYEVRSERQIQFRIFSSVGTVNLVVP